jgi:hypothetical protein
MLLAPAAFLLFSAARAMSEVRDARARTLWRLGIASRRIRLLVALETALLSAAGAIPGAALWMAFLGSTSRVPLTVAELRPGALAVSLPAVIVVVLAVVTLAATSTALGRIWRRNVRTDARTVRPWHAAPLVVAFLMMAVGPWLPPTSGLRLYLLFGGLLLTFAALPMALPAVVQGLGGHMGRSSSPAVWLAGRRLALRSANLAKPAAMVGALVFVAGAAFALYDRLVAAEENHGSRAPFAAFRVDWRDQRPGDVAAAANASPTLAVLPLTGEESGSPQVHFGSCGQIKRLVRAPMEACEADGHLRDQFRAYFTQITAVVPVIGGGDNAHALYVIGAKQVTPHEVMRALAATMPAVNISELGGASKTRDPRAGWMLAGWTLATLVLTTALVREIGDRGLSSMHDIGHLLRLGLRREEIERSYRWSLLPPVAVAIPIGFLGAVLFALLGYELGITIGNLGRIALVAGIAGLISVATFAIVLRLQHRLSALED